MYIISANHSLKCKRGSILEVYGYGKKTQNTINYVYLATIAYSLVQRAGKKSKTGHFTLK